MTNDHTDSKRTIQEINQENLHTLKNYASNLYILLKIKGIAEIIVIGKNMQIIASTVNTNIRFITCMHRLVDISLQNVLIRLFPVFGLLFQQNVTMIQVMIGTSA